MELIKSRGMVVFLIIVLGVTIISSLGTKKYDSVNDIKDNTYIFYRNN